jgi:hypothetical protein
MLHTFDAVRSASTADGKILLDTRDGRIFSLNIIGSKILELLEQGLNEQRIAERISSDCAGNIATIRTDVHEFIEALQKHRIVRSTDSAHSS